MMRPCKRPRDAADGNRQGDADAGIFAPVMHREAAGEAQHAADREVELANDHGEAERQRDRPDGRELLQHAERRRPG